MSRRFRASAAQLNLWAWLTAQPAPVLVVVAEEPAEPVDPSVCACGLLALDCPRCLPGGDTVEAFIARNPDGASLEEVAQALGLTRERVRQIEVGAQYRIREDDYEPGDAFRRAMRASSRAEAAE